MDSEVTNQDDATIGTWFKSHSVSLLAIAACTALVLWFLEPVDVLLAALGLGFIIFIHELGHFLAAKACDVHVKTFSIGFGPALPFCSHKLGETTYKLALIPLGGFVSMVGQEDGVVDESEDPDPRSYRNKSVPQRMLIISAGVIMNLLLAAACFVIAYLHGVEDKPAVVARIEPGSTAWRAGFTMGTRVTKVGSLEHPMFDDMRPIVMSCQKGELLPVRAEFAGESRDLSIEPLREEGQLYPALGVAWPNRLDLIRFRRGKVKPFGTGSAAEAAKTADGSAGFEAGDAIIAMTDPADPKRGVTPIVAGPNDQGIGWFEYHRRLARLAGEPVTLHVRRYGQPESSAPVAVTVPPVYRRQLGLRMRMGPVAAVRTGSPAEKSGIVAKSNGTPDRIVSVDVTSADGKSIRFTTDESERVKLPGANMIVKPLDPIRLPFELNRWADAASTPGTVIVTVLREVDHTEKRVILPPMTWDPRHRFDDTPPYSPFSPIAINGLGLAYSVLNVVDGVDAGSAAAEAGAMPNDEVVEIQLSGMNEKHEIKVGSWQELKPSQWASTEHSFQHNAPAAADPAVHRVGLKVKRGGETVELQIDPRADTTWPIEERGLLFEYAMEVQQSDSIGGALGLGMKRTSRTIRSTYLSLYGMITGRTSVKLISGPITLARVSYIFAGQDIWQLLILMGVISVNLAVVNFLPIPVLDGGHMMFLLYEWIRGKPAPERVQEYLVYIGLACVGGLMILSLTMDIRRLIF